MIALGTSSFVHLASECRCPPSHPVIDPINSFRCTQHTGHSIDRGTVQRLNQQATPPGFMNNMHSGDQWISAINQPAANVTIKLSYTNFNFEVRNGATLYEFKHISIHLYLIHRYFISYCILEVHVQKQQFYSSQMTMGKVILYFNIMLMTAWSISESQIIMTCVQQQIPRMFELCYYIPYNLILLLIMISGKHLHQVDLYNLYCQQSQVLHLTLEYNLLISLTIHKLPPLIYILASPKLQ